MSGITLREAVEPGGMVFLHDHMRLGATFAHLTGA